MRYFSSWKRDGIIEVGDVVVIHTQTNFVIFSMLCFSRKTACPHVFRLGFLSSSVEPEQTFMPLGGYSSLSRIFTTVPARDEFRVPKKARRCSSIPRDELVNLKVYSGKGLR